MYWKFIVSPDFTGKTVLITGASSGIGEALVHKFVELNAKKVIISARRLDQLVRVKNACKLKKGQQEVDIKILDLSDPDVCYEWAKNFEGRVDILVNNGGISQREQFIHADFKIAKHLMNVNALSPIALIKGFIPKF